MIGLVTSELGRAVRDAVRGSLGAHSMAGVRAFRDDGTTDADPPGWQRLAADGWLGARVPEALGGAGLSAEAASAIPDLFGEVLAVEPYVAMGLLPALVLVGLEDRGDMLEALLSGRRRYAFAWQEQRGQVLAGNALAATVVDSALIGSKRFVAAGVAADHFLVTARLDGKSVVAVIEGDAPGVAVHASRQIDGSVFADVDFDRAPVTACQLVDVVTIDKALDEARIMLAVQLVAIARRALAITIDYTKTRQQFGQPIGAFQALQHRMVDYASRIRLSEVACDAAISALDDPQSSPNRIARLAAAAKASAAEAAVAVTQGAIQLHGAIGYTDEADIGLYLAAALTHAPWLGTAEALRDRFLDLGGVASHA